jgi:hypothetical protein
VLSAELLDDADEADEDERPAPHDQAESARTDRPPPFSIPVRASVWRSRELRVIAAIAAAIAAPVLLAFVLEPPGPRVALAPSPVPASTTPPSPAHARAPGTCAIDGNARLLARRALVRGGVEAVSLGERVAFATLTSPRSGTAFELDARTLAVRGSARVVTSDPLRHVVPELGDDAPVEAQADTASLRTLADAEGDFAVGARDGFIVWGPREGDGMVRLWRLPWPQAVDAPRVSALGTGGERVLAFRRGGGTTGGIWVGSFRGGEVTSDLARLSASAIVGAPALDAHGDEAIVAWAQRDSATSPWGVRWARWTPHAGAGAVHDLALPPGGPGDRAMAPSVTALDGGRLLLAWTEAGHGRNQVRAQVFDGDDRPLGDVLTVSPEDVVAGQEQVALTDDGHGAVAYLVARRGSFELRATAIDCSPR